MKKSTWGAAVGGFGGSQPLLMLSEMGNKLKSNGKQKDKRLQRSKGADKEINRENKKSVKGI